MIFVRISTASLYLVFCCITIVGCRTEPKISSVSEDVFHPWLLPFEKQDSVNPIMAPGNLSFTCPILGRGVKWENKNVYNPATAVRGDTLFMLYRAQDSAGCSRIGLAKSTDGIHFDRYLAPVLYPDNDAHKFYEWPGGCEDPRLVEDNSGTYYLTYTAYDGKIARLMLATSTDLYHWKKLGPVFTDTQYKEMWSKSGSIISNYSNGRVIATKIGDSYYMYWGDKYIWLASSPDLIHWTILEKDGEQNGYDSSYSNYDISNLRIAIPTRQGKFDCDLVESGPPAMLTDKGILLIYNSRSIPATGDSSLPLGTYTVSQVLLDKNDPGKITERMNTYFLKPEQPYEFSGEVNNVCFAEGLAFYHNKWWLYYGTADSKIAVAIKDQPPK